MQTREGKQRTNRHTVVNAGGCGVQCVIHWLSDIHWRANIAIRNVFGRRRSILPSRAGIQADKSGRSWSQVPIRTGTASWRRNVNFRSSRELASKLYKTGRSFCFGPFWRLQIQKKQTPLTHNSAVVQMVERAGRSVLRPTAVSAHLHNPRIKASDHFHKIRLISHHLFDVLVHARNFVGAG